MQRFVLNPDRMKEWPVFLWIVLAALVGLILGILGFLFWKYIVFNIWWIYLIYIGVLVLYFVISNCFAKEMHIHHYNVGILVMIFIGYQHPFSTIIHGIFNGVMIEGCTRYNCGPIFKYDNKILDMGMG